MCQPFKVIEKRSSSETTIYAVKVDKNGYPCFLVYVKTRNSWVRVKAKHFVPVEY